VIPDHQESVEAWLVANMKWEEFKRRFPHLAGELESGDIRLRIDSVRSVSEEANKAASDSSGCTPTAIDYLRRCDNEKDALDTIGYLESKGEITTEYATALRDQLKMQGIRSFGPRKDEAHYQRQAAKTQTSV